jgi:hypothetical protein
MNPTTARRVAVPVATLIALAAVGVLVTSYVGRADAANPRPTASPVVTPQPVASPSPIASPVPAPSAPTGGLFEFPLDIAVGEDVEVVVKDESGVVTGAKSGRAGDGMSVRWGRVQVENVDSDTLRLTWVGLPISDRIGVVVSGTPDDLRISITHISPPENSDATGYDRVLLLDLAEDVRAEAVAATLRSGMDT